MFKTSNLCDLRFLVVLVGLGIICVESLLVPQAVRLVANELSRRNGRYLSMSPSSISIQPAKIKVEEEKWKIIPDIWETLSVAIPNHTMLVDPVHGDTIELTFSKVNDLIIQGAAALQKLGLGPGDCVSIFAENSHRWFLIEQSVMKLGGCNAVRGALAPLKELKYIYENSKSVGLVVESPSLLQQLLSQGMSLPGPPKFVVVLFSQNQTGEELQRLCKSEPSTKIFTYQELLNTAASSEFKPVVRDSSSTATLVYTSGTTSSPKGAVLRHSNLLHQVKFNSFNNNNGGIINPQIGDIFVSILPCWHIFERTAEYFCLSRGTQLVYSNLRNFKKDLILWRPHILIAVPRLLENIHKGIVTTLKQQSKPKRMLISVLTAACQLYLYCFKTYQNVLLRTKRPGFLKRALNGIGALLLWPLFKLADYLVWKKIRDGVGGRLKVIVSGGSSLPLHIEHFFDMAGLRVLAGYGLTETSPVIASRQAESNVLASVGRIMPDTEIRIVDQESRRPVEPGASGVLLVKGPGVMAGYMQDPVATSAAIDKDGYFDTGDLAKINPATGALVIVGRAKDTIVLSNGENVEPAPIEEALVATCPLVEQVMLVGQDERFLSALVVVNVPEAIQRGLIDPSVAQALQEATAKGPQGLQQLRELAAVVDANEAIRNDLRAGFDSVCATLRPWEKIGQMKLIVEPFSLLNGQLTQTLKIKRNEVAKFYSSDIAALYSKRSKT